MTPSHRIVQKSYNKLYTTGPTQAKIREYLMCSISHSPITGDSQMPGFARGNVEFTIETGPLSLNIIYYSAWGPQKVRYLRPLQTKRLEGGGLKSKKPIRNLWDLTMEFLEGWSLQQSVKTLNTGGMDTSWNYTIKYKSYCWNFFRHVYEHRCTMAW